MAALALGGCGGGDGPSDETQVRDTLRTFATAVEKRDYQTLCDEVFAPKLLQGLESIGLPCEVALARSTLSQVKDPQLTVGEVTVDGKSASAEVRTSSEGRKPSSDTVELVKISGRWRVAALGAPERPTPTATATATAAKTATAGPSPSP
jgi:hypothetical protein